MVTPGRARLRDREPARRLSRAASLASAACRTRSRTPSTSGRTGQRQVRGEPRSSERAVDAVVDELRRRLGSTFTLDELADLYGSGTDWATDVAARVSGGADAHDRRRRRLRPLRPRGSGLRGRAAEANRSEGLASVVVGVGSRRSHRRSGADDDDAVGLDRHDDGAVAGPVLGVDRVVLDGGVEPEAVALVAVVERPLESRLLPRRLCGARGRRGARGGEASGLLVAARSSSESSAPRPRRSASCSASSAAATSASSSARRSSSSSSATAARGGGSTSSPASAGARPCSRLKPRMSPTDTSSWWAIQASVRPLADPGPDLVQLGLQ